MIPIDFSSARVLVVGDVILDRYIYGTVNRISPEAPIPVVTIGNINHKAGGAANVAANVAALGAKSVHLIGITGDDNDATTLESVLNQYGNLTHRLLRVGTHRTVVKSRIVARNQQMLRLDADEDWLTGDGFDRSILLSYFINSLADCDVVVLSDYNKGTLTDVRAMIRYAKEARLPVLVDPRGKDFLRYRGATLLTPNTKELELAVNHGDPLPEESLTRKANELRVDVGVDAILVTRSERGMTLVESADSVVHIDAHTHEICDVSGAGDTVIATIAACLSIGHGLTESCRVANLAAGIVVTKQGTATVSVDEINAHVGLTSTVSKLCLSLSDLNQRISQKRQTHESCVVVMTNGCFDVLHAGHIRSLKESKSMGDILVVAMNSDESIRSLKGLHRPFHSFAERAEVLAALNCVDFIIEFDAPTPIDIIRAVRPDILTKGGDYTESEVIGHEEVIAYGGKVVTTPFHDGHSSTAIIDALRESY